MRQRLLDAAGQSFWERGYRSSSVSAICRRAGVANGSFYQYFADRQAVLAELLATLREALGGSLRRAAEGGRDLKGRVSAVAAALYELFVQRPGLLHVLREAEFVAPDAARALYEELEELLPACLRVSPGPVGALSAFVVGSVYFNAVARTAWGLEHQPLPAIVDQLLYGQAPAGASPALWRAPVGPSGGEVTVPLPASAEAVEPTRRRLLDAGEGLLGELGYEACSIARLTAAAGVGQGTFYLYFQSKDELLAEVVRRTNLRLKLHTARAVAGVTHRLSMEALALRAFARFALRRRAVYRVVREAEFVDRAVGSWYYLDLAEGYRSTLESAMALGQVRSMDPLSLGLSIMGLLHHLGMRWPVWEQAEVPEAVLVQSIELMMRGILGGNAHA